MASTPRVGALGVATTLGDIYVVDSNGDLSKLEKGADEQVLISKAGAVNADGDQVDLEWANIDELSRESIEGDATDSVFKQVNPDGGGAVVNPQTKTRGTHAVLEYDKAVRRGIPWQKYIGPNYSGDDLTLSIYWCLNDAGAPTGTDVVWKAAFERNEAGHLVTTDAFAALQSAAAVAAGADGVIVKSTIAFTQAQADAIAAGDPFRLYIERDAGQGDDDLDADVQIVRWVLEEDA